MAKRNYTRNSNGNKSSKKVYTTSTGVVLTFVPLKQFQVDEVRKSVKFPKRPTYKLTTDVGSVEEYELTEKNYENLDDSEETAHNREVLDRYYSDTSEADALLKDRLITVFLAKGVECEGIPEADSDWAEEQRYLGIDVPKALIARKVLYLKTEAIQSEQDVISILDYVMETSGISKERQNAAKASFRSALEEVKDTGAVGAGAAGG